MLLKDMSDTAMGEIVPSSSISGGISRPLRRSLVVEVTSCMSVALDSPVDSTVRWTMASSGKRVAVWWPRRVMLREDMVDGCSIRNEEDGDGEGDEGRTRDFGV
jgi:hypothetical protein